MLWVVAHLILTSQVLELELTFILHVWFDTLTSVIKRFNTGWLNFQKVPYLRFLKHWFQAQSMILTSYYYYVILKSHYFAIKPFLENGNNNFL